MAGPALFRGYDRAALDREYDNRTKVPGFDFAGFLRDCDAQSQAARARHDCVLDLAYGPGAAEKLDIFRAAVPNAPVHVFFHGGYWRMLDKRDFSYVADGIVPHGVTLVVVNYALMPAVTMAELVAQCRRALQWIDANIGQYGGDASRVSLSGHSAGGHLVAMMLASAAVPPMVHACAISGIFELEPIRHCFLNDTLGLQPADVEQNSPRWLPRQHWCPLTIAVGEREGDEYLRQSRDFGVAWSGERGIARVVVMPGIDHFSIRAQLGDPASAMVAMALGH
ncbi:MAG: hypothetical protein JWP36_1372 [Paucimonas sp.]|nr:hypothetical protein [Paucimonas sp.]